MRASRLVSFGLLSPASRCSYGALPYMLLIPLCWHFGRDTIKGQESPRLKASSLPVLYSLLQNNSSRYPYLDERERAKIFAAHFSKAVESAELTNDAVAYLLQQAVNNKKFIALNAIITHHPELCSAELLSEIERQLPLISYDMLTLRSEGLLAEQFEDAFFSMNTGELYSRILCVNAEFPTNLRSYMSLHHDQQERKVFFHDGNHPDYAQAARAVVRGSTLDCENPNRLFFLKLLSNQDQSQHPSNVPRL